MGRLIDADELIKYIKIWEIGTSISSDQKEFIDCVNEQPTVFDVDKVVEQLEEERENVGFVKATTEASAYIRGINDAIKIVKGGGVDGN